MERRGRQDRRPVYDETHVMAASRRQAGTGALVLYPMPRSGVASADGSTWTVLVTQPISLPW